MEKRIGRKGKMANTNAKNYIYFSYSRFTSRKWNCPLYWTYSSIWICVWKHQEDVLNRTVLPPNHQEHLHVIALSFLNVLIFSKWRWHLLDVCASTVISMSSDKGLLKNWSRPSGRHQISYSFPKYWTIQVNERSLMIW